VRRITLDIYGMKIRLIAVNDEAWDASGETNQSSWLRVNFAYAPNPLEVIAHEIGHIIFTNFYSDAIKNNTDLASVNEICASISEKTVMAIAKNERKINDFIRSQMKTDNTPKKELSKITQPIEQNHTKEEPK